MKYKGILGYALILFLVISNVFNYNTAAKYRTEFKVITETISTVENEIESIEVLISYIDIETNDKLIEDDFIIRGIGEEVIGDGLKKEIEGYRFKEAIPESIIVSRDNKEIKLYYEKNEIIPIVEYIDVTVNHFITDTEKKVAESDILGKVKVGTMLSSKDYIKNISGYEFDNIVEEHFEVSKESNVINIYYKRVDTSNPVKPGKPNDLDKPNDNFEEFDNNKPNEDNGDSVVNESNENLGKEEDLPKTGGRNIIWIGYIFLLLGVIVNLNKKERYVD